MQRGKIVILANENYYKNFVQFLVLQGLSHTKLLKKSVMLHFQERLNHACIYLKIILIK